MLAIKANGILSKARVRPGFVITHINDKSVRSLSDMQRMTDKVRSIDGVYPDGRSASYVLVEYGSARKTGYVLPFFIAVV